MFSHVQAGFREPGTGVPRLNGTHGPIMSHPRCVGGYGESSERGLGRRVVGWQAGGHRFHQAGGPWRTSVCELDDWWRVTVCELENWHERQYTSSNYINRQWFSWRKVPRG